MDTRMSRHASSVGHDDGVRYFRDATTALLSEGYDVT